MSYSTSCIGKNRPCSAAQIEASAACPELGKVPSVKGTNFQ
ncbi:MAG: hypothetical protein U0164_15205 [Gemmatimonadaceae bacterium]